MKQIVLGAAFVALLAAYLPAHAQPEPPKGAPNARSQAESLLSPQERDQFREKMRAAKSREERAEIRKQMRGTVEQRAKEKGITLPQGRDGRMGPRESRLGGDSTRPRLFTPEERQQYRDKMRAAKTPEERAEIQKQMRAAMAQRAKEKGVTLPRGPDGRRPQLLTTDERLQYRDKMRAAKTPEERAVLRKQLRELTEQRAKEKGVTLPERRGRGEPPKGPGPAGKS